MQPLYVTDAVFLPVCCCLQQLRQCALALPLWCCLQELREMQLLHVTRLVAHVIPDLEALATSHEVKSSAVMDRQRMLASNRLRQHQRQVSGRLPVKDGAAGFWLHGATSRTSWVPANVGALMVLISGQQLL